MTRNSGVLMHITSLPSAGPVGNLGKSAYAFADFLSAAGMRIWQVLPIGPTGYGESPYQSPGTFAGNPLLIDPVMLQEEGLLSGPLPEIYRAQVPGYADFDLARRETEKLLRQCFSQSRDKLKTACDTWRKSNLWVEDYALFTALKARFDGKPWHDWPDREIRLHRAGALERCKAELRDEIEYHVFVQYLFRRQWLALKKYCNDKNIQIFGDMPIYVAEDSADTWTHAEVFQLDRNRVPKRVAGVPPDYFSKDGQLWGNSLYRWHRLRMHGYDWWVERMRGASELYDLIRIDHFIGFANYYSVPYGAPNARNGKWIKGPGISLFKKLQKQIPSLQVVAEDLGCVTPRVEKLLKQCGYPGMKVMQFGFDGGSDNPHYPDHYPVNSIAYTGTHDNNTLLGWAKECTPEVLRHAQESVGFNNPEDLPQSFISKLFSMESNTVIVPMQDLLRLDERARMNFPGTVGGINWKWRMDADAIPAELAAKLYSLNLETKRGL